LNAANEAAVQSFLDGDLHFTEIVPACRSVLGAHQFEPNPTLERLMALDRWARQEISRWVCAWCGLIPLAIHCGGDRGVPSAGNHLCDELGHFLVQAAA
jgi:hypothetical protein